MILWYLDKTNIECFVILLVVVAIYFVITNIFVVSNNWVQFEYNTYHCIALCNYAFSLHKILSSPDEATFFFRKLAELGVGGMRKPLFALGGKLNHITISYYVISLITLSTIVSTWWSGLILSKRSKLGSGGMRKSLFALGGKLYHITR